MSGEQSPLLGGALPAYETFITQWQAIANLSLHPQLCPFIEEGLSWVVNTNSAVSNCSWSSYGPQSSGLFSEIGGGGVSGSIGLPFASHIQPCQKFILEDHQNM